MLLLASLFFYTWGEWEIVLVMIVSTIIDFCAGIIIEKKNRKLGLIISILTNLSFLGFFKYADFAFENFNYLLQILELEEHYLLTLPHIALPIGISFYTFQTMSYTIDVYRGKVKANRNFIDFAAYVTMFPQLVAGPIVRYADINQQLLNRNHNITKFSQGVERFIIGMAKKMILANAFAEVADTIFALPTNEISIATAWLGVIAYSFQIYFDFSAYSDMAIGLGKMFGFDFLENFNYPYISKSIKEFWRRWHISLSTWFRDYLYIPLGGNRVSNYRIYINLLIVFFITGMWHGASWNFIVWGLFHGFFLILERIWLGKILEKIWQPISFLYTIVVVIIGWVFFRADNLTSALNYLGAMFGNNNSELIYDYKMFLFNKHYIVIFLGILFSMPIYINVKEALSNTIKKAKQRTLLRYSYNVFLIALFIFSISFVASDSYNPFIYYRF